LTNRNVCGHGPPGAFRDQAKTIIQASALASQAGDAGRVQTVTDPRGIATKTDYDLLGRALRTVAAFGNNPLFSNNWNQVTENTYDGDNHVLTLTVYPATGSIERTQYTYTANPPDSTWVSSSDQLTLVQYPDKTTGLPSCPPFRNDCRFFPVNR
jgi:YD repeat-containing protein